MNWGEVNEKLWHPVDPPVVISTFWRGELGSFYLPLLLLISWCLVLPGTFKITYPAISKNRWQNTPTYVHCTPLSPGNSLHRLRGLLFELLAGNTAEAQRRLAKPEPHLTNSEPRATWQPSPSGTQWRKPTRCNECEKKRHKGLGRQPGCTEHTRQGLTRSGRLPANCCQQFAASGQTTCRKGIFSRDHHFRTSHKGQLEKGVQWDGGRNTVQPSWRAGAAGEVFQTAVRLQLGSKQEEYAAGEAVTSHHVTAPEDSHIPKRQRSCQIFWAGQVLSGLRSGVFVFSFTCSGKDGRKALLQQPLLNHRDLDLIGPWKKAVIELIKAISGYHLNNTVSSPVCRT